MFLTIDIIGRDFSKRRKCLCNGCKNSCRCIVKKIINIRIRINTSNWWRIADNLDGLLKSENDLEEFLRANFSDFNYILVHFFFFFWCPIRNSNVSISVPRLDHFLRNNEIKILKRSLDNFLNDFKFRRLQRVNVVVIESTFPPFFFLFFKQLVNLYTKKEIRILVSPAKCK